MYKTVVVLSDGMKTRIPEALNAIGHLGQSLGAQMTSAGAGRFVDYADGEGGSYPALSWWPVIVLSARRAKLRPFWMEAAAVGIRAGFLETMFAGGTEVQLEQTALLSPEAHDFAGVAVFGQAQDLDPLTRKFSLWRV